MSPHELEEKFKAFATHVISSPRAEEVMELIHKLETLKNLSPIAKNLAKRIAK
jgi:hypothetical protein